MPFMPSTPYELKAIALGFMIAWLVKILLPKHEYRPDN